MLHPIKMCLMYSECERSTLNYKIFWSFAEQFQLNKILRISRFLQKNVHSVVRLEKFKFLEHLQHPI